MKDPTFTELADTPSYVPSPTVHEFISAMVSGSPLEMRVLILESSRGEGKTTAAQMAIVALAQRLQREKKYHALPIRVGVVRDTWASLSRTTLESMRDMQKKGLPIEFKDGGQQVIVAFDRPLVHYYCFGLDRPEDADRLQGLELGVLWLEEVAPASGFTVGVPAESLGLGATSVRQRDVPPRIILTMNPPDREHWSVKVRERLEDLGMKELRVARFRIPKGEKSEHFRQLAAKSSSSEDAMTWNLAADAFDAYRKRNETLLRETGREDLVARLVDGEVGEVKVGEAVVPTFSRNLHIVRDKKGKPDRLPIFPGIPILRAWDGGSTPSTVFMQALGESGRDGLNILGSHTSENSSMVEHIRNWVLPFMDQCGILPTAPTGYGSRRLKWEYRDIGDPSLLHEGKTTRGAESTSGAVIYELLNATLEPGPVDWDSRRESLIWAFRESGKKDRPRLVQIEEATNEMLILALAGRFRYPKDIARNKAVYTVEAAKRESGIYGQAPDALAYGLAVLYPVTEVLRSAGAQRAPSVPSRPKSWIGA